MKILIVDDHPYNRDLLRFILEDEGYDCVDAENGIEACSLVREDLAIDIVLMDINMPEMNGIQATEIIKSEAGERFIPVIFVTALDDAEVVSQCLNAGGDDFVPKPVNENILLSKINAHARSKNLYSTLQTTNEQLLYHQKLMDREHSIVEHMFARGLSNSSSRCDNIRTYTSPVSMFDGDMVLSAAAPNGGLYVVVGDFTGHGLAAAIGSLPATELFFGLVSRLSSVPQIASAFNTRLYEFLPMSMFCCATILYVNHEGREVTLWSGGMNDILRVKPGASSVEKVCASHMPLGILKPEEFDETPAMIQLEPGEKIYIYTDGVNEATNINDEEFGLDRLEQLVLEGGENVVEKVTAAVSNFLVGIEQQDDISIVEITGGNLIHRDNKTGDILDVRAEYYKARSFPWRLSMRLQNDDLKDPNVINQVLGFFKEIRGIELHQSRIYTILSELYSNALEHGVLKLDSSLKASADGFEEYYKLRNERLEALVDSFIELEFVYQQGDTNLIRLVVTDSGNGFDYKTVREAVNRDEERHGRGLNLLENLCSSLEFSNNGRTVTAVYPFRE